jgi:hypothetical protein
MNRPRILSALLFMWTLACPSQAGADEFAKCNSALVRGQELTRDLKFLEARAEYPKCVRDVCDPSLRSVCANFLAELATKIPSLRIDVRDEGGTALTDVHVYVDTVQVPNVAAPVDVNPGRHVVRVEAARYVTREIVVLVKEGERSRAIEIVLQRDGFYFSPRAEEPRDGRDANATVQTVHSPLPASVYVFGAASALALGSFGFFALEGKSTERGLRQTCPSGPCDSAAMRREYLVADISLGVALVAAGVATWIALTHDRAATTNAAHSLRGETRHASGHAVFFPPF